ncbi:hypothetical protein GCM10022217_00100 [Chryseobacterium ginsenosidimutans]
MKWSFKIFLFCALVLIIKSKAQSLDTLSYLKQFEVNKANYIGQPFSKLLNNMIQIQPKTSWSFPFKSQKNKIHSSDFNFCNKNKSYYNAVTLHIIWQTPILTSQTKYYEQLNGFYFTDDEKSFYGSKIIKDIMVYR